MGIKLYVGNLPFEITEDELKGAFASHGEVVEARIITDKWTDKSRGFGFVEMSSQEEAQKAIDELNGSALGGRDIVVNEARPMEERRGGHDGGGGRGRSGNRDRDRRGPPRGRR